MAGLSLQELGQRIGVSRPTIYAYANGTLNVPLSRLSEIARVTNQPISFFAPKTIEHLPAESMTSNSLRIIDALLAPANPRKAVEVSEQALSELSDSAAPQIRAEILRRTGNALAMAGEFVKSLEYLEEARKIFVNVNENSKLGAIYQTEAYCRTSLAQLTEAELAFNRAQENLPVQDKWKAQVGLAALEERKGHLDAARTILGKLLDDSTLGESTLAYVRANYASLVCSQGQFHSGVSLTEIALQASLSCGLTDQVAEMEIQLSICYGHLGRFHESILMCLRSRDVAYASKDESRLTFAEIQNAWLLMNLGQLSEARKVASKAYNKAIENQFRRSESQALLVLSQLAFLRSDFESSLEILNQSLSHSRAHGFVLAEAESLYRYLKVKSELGHPLEKTKVDRLKTISSETGSVIVNIFALDAEGDLMFEKGLLGQASQLKGQALEIASDHQLTLLKSQLSAPRFGSFLDDEVGEASTHELCINILKTNSLYYNDIREISQQ